jgi:hypothetical protein
VMRSRGPGGIFSHEPKAADFSGHQSDFRRVPNSLGDRRIGTGAEQTDAELWMVGNAPLMPGSR